MIFQGPTGQNHTQINEMRSRKAHLSAFLHLITALFSYKTWKTRIYMVKSTKWKIVHSKSTKLAAELCRLHHGRIECTVAVLVGDVCEKALLNYLFFSDLFMNEQIHFPNACLITFLLLATKKSESLESWLKYFCISCSTARFSIFKFGTYFR